MQRSAKKSKKTYTELLRVPSRHASVLLRATVVRLPAAGATFLAVGGKISAQRVLHLRGELRNVPPRNDVRRQVEEIEKNFIPIAKEKKDTETRPPRDRMPESKSNLTVERR